MSCSEYAVQTGVIDSVFVQAIALVTFYGLCIHIVIYICIILKFFDVSQVCGLWRMGGSFFHLNAWDWFPWLRRIWDDHFKIQSLCFFNAECPTKVVELFLHTQARFSIVFWCSWLDWNWNWDDLIYTRIYFIFSTLQVTFLRHFSKGPLALSMERPKLQIPYLTSFFEVITWSLTITHWRGTDMWVCDMVWCHLRLLTSTTGHSTLTGNKKKNIPSMWASKN